MDTMDGTEKRERRPRRRYTDEFRAGAVGLVLKEERRVAEAARDLDIGESLLHLWVRQAKVDAGQAPTGALATEEKAELSRLRKENRELRIERDILKKAAAFFAKTSA
jgi:transposase